MTTTCKECGEWIDIDNKSCSCSKVSQIEQEDYQLFVYYNNGFKYKFRGEVYSPLFYNRRNLHFKYSTIDFFENNLSKYTKNIILGKLQYVAGGEFLTSSPFLFWR